MKHVLLINITRMGDLVQMGTLLQRLQHEWPGVAVDLICDRRFAPIADLLPHLRHVVTYDFHDLIDESRAQTKDLVTLYQEMTRWAAPLVAARYDRIINLTFNRRSGLLTSYIGAKDIRGIAAPKNGDVAIHNPWMAYLTDVHHQRRLNPFNLVDIYAMGGSGPGPFAPLSIRVPDEAAQWADAFFANQPGDVRMWVAVQVGASEPIKAWRPELFGQTLAALSRTIPVGFILIGTEKERKDAAAATAVYRQAQASAPLCDVVGKTNLPQLAALLQRCRLLLTNDTGPMHIAVGVGTPVIDLSVGHVDFRETGPYGPGHWVVQPEMACAPCGFDHVCFHHACKDRVIPSDIAALCEHVLTDTPFPQSTSGIRIYQSLVDEDGLGAYQLRAGHEDSLIGWYGKFWRRFWYEDFTGSETRLPELSDPPPDMQDAGRLLSSLEEVGLVVLEKAERLVHLSKRQPLPIAALQQAEAHERSERQHIIRLGMQLPIAIPLTVSLVRDVHTDDGHDVSTMARARLATYRRWQRRLRRVRAQLDGLCRADGRAHHRRFNPLPMANIA